MDDIKDFFDRLTPEKLQPEKLKPKQASEPAPLADPNDTGALSDEEATDIAESNAFRRNLFLSPTAFARGTLGRTGQSRLNV